MGKPEIITEIKRQYSLISIDTKRFAIKAFLLAVVFNFAYLFFLGPTRLLDRPLTNFTTHLINPILNHFYKEGFAVIEFQTHDLITYNKRRLLIISDGCNALKLYVLYLGFLLCVPGAIAKKLIYLIIGFSLILILNLTRLFALIWLLFNKPAWTNVAHHYIFTTIVYAFIFFLWVSYLKGRKLI